jgi:hypothetical protein
VNQASGCEVHPPVVKLPNIPIEFAFASDLSTETRFSTRKRACPTKSTASTGLEAHRAVGHSSNRKSFLKD